MMPLLHLSVPPMPYYTACGEAEYQLGEMHTNRKNLGFFDLIVVTKGCLDMGEESLRWSIQAGESLILRPDLYHYGAAKCDEVTHFFWLHFRTAGNWWEEEEGSRPGGMTPIQDTEGLKLFEGLHPFDIFPLKIPRYGKLADTSATYNILRQLVRIRKQQQTATRWKQQTLFLQLLQEISASKSPDNRDPGFLLAEKAAEYLREHFRDKISYQSLGELLHFHPTYIARCMGRVFGYGPLEYLNSYRLQQAKLLLMNTNVPIGSIAEEVGFSHVSYFNRRFLGEEGVTPRAFRNKYR